ncbi:MAG: undecaprenyl-diphosphate phosphatase [Lachnospiraceae bacterium]|jgi:undecaprenyl-diphosphatase|nr:undecaprenyl-diphosphate phosphatase [Lachnospiraceae bacterium]
MTIWKAIIMGVIQGLAEFLPISSSGHLAIFKHILNIDLENGGLLFDVLLHLGTLIAVFIAFWSDIRKLIVEGFGIIGGFFANVGRMAANVVSRPEGGKREWKPILNTPYRRFVMLIIVSTIPTGILGLALQDVIERASATLIVPGIFLILTAILLLVAENYRPKNAGRIKEKNATYTQALIVGTAQGIATMPGLSRSGSTITACLLCGFDKSFAVRYSFIMSIPAILGALVLELKDFGSETIAASELWYYAAGTLVSAVVGYICIKTMLVVVRQKKFRYFAYYCFVVGLTAVMWNFL